VLVMKSRIGIPTGRVMVLTNDPVVPNMFADSSIKVRPVSSDDVKLFVEQCERYLLLSEDLHRLALPGNISKVATLTSVPPTYGRIDVAKMINSHSGVDVDPRNIVFRFTHGGRQSDMVWVLCKTASCCLRLISSIQEVAVPLHIQSGNLFGCSFVWSNRNSLFLSAPELDYVPSRSPFQVFTTGWHSDMDVQEFTALLSQLKFFPRRLTKYECPKEDCASFFMEFDRMRMAKKCMKRLHQLKQRWQIPQNDVFYAYPRLVDVRWAHDATHADQKHNDDLDIDEPIEY